MTTPTIGFLQVVPNPDREAIKTELSLRPLTGYTRFTKLDQELGILQTISNDIAEKQLKYFIPVPLEGFKKLGSVKSFKSFDIGKYDDVEWIQGIQVKNVKKGNMQETLVILIPYGFPSVPDRNPIVLTLNFPDPAWVEKIVKFYIQLVKQWQKSVNK